MQAKERPKFDDSSPKPKIRAVLADDEPIMIMNLREILTDNGYEVVGTAEDGFEAIDICRKQHPDVAVLDIQMTLLDGLTTAKYIYEENLAETIVIVSAFSDNDFIERASRYGVAGYLVKPVDGKTLLSTIAVARARSKELHGLQSDITKITKDMESRKKIERAKGLIMQMYSISENDAYTRIRTISKERNMSMELVADIILCGNEKT